MTDMLLPADLVGQVVGASGTLALMVPDLSMSAISVVDMKATWYIVD